MILAPLMTLAEVARYLRLTETEVITMAEQRILPSGKIGAEWRFRRSDVERWLRTRFQSPEPAPSAAVTINQILTPERTIFLSGGIDKKIALEKMCAAIAQAPEIGDADELTKQVFNRETVLSTSIGVGVGVPHARLASVTGMVMALGVSSEPIADYKNLFDEQPVRIICLIAAHIDQQSQYLRLLAGLAHFMKNDATRQTLLAAPDPQTAYEIMAQMKL